MARQSKICCDDVKSKNFGKFLLQTLTAFAAFIGGFLAGTVVDAVFYRIYLKWDPSRKDLKKLLTIVALQVLVLAIILSFERNYAPVRGLDAIVFRLALVMAQIFMVKYAMERISDKLYHRTEVTSQLVLRALAENQMPPSNNPYMRSIFFD